MKNSHEGRKHNHQHSYYYCLIEEMKVQKSITSLSVSPNTSPLIAPTWLNLFSFLKWLKSITDAALHNNKQQ